MTHGRPNRRELLQIGAAVGGSLLAGQKALALEADPRKLGTPLGPVRRAVALREGGALDPRVQDP